MFGFVWLAAGVFGSLILALHTLYYDRKAITLGDIVFLLFVCIPFGLLSFVVVLIVLVPETELFRKEIIKPKSKKNPPLTLTHRQTVS